MLDRPSRGRRRLPADGRLTVNLEAETLRSWRTPPSRRASRPTCPSSSSARQYWPSVPSLWQESHNSFGVTQTATRWALAEGQAGLADCRADLHSGGEQQPSPDVSAPGRVPSRDRRADREDLRRAGELTVQRPDRVVRAPSSRADARSASARWSPAPAARSWSSARSTTAATALSGVPAPARPGRDCRDVRGRPGYTRTW